MPLFKSSIYSAAFTCIHMYTKVKHNYLWTFELCFSLLKNNAAIKHVCKWFIFLWIISLE